MLLGWQKGIYSATELVEFVDSTRLSDTAIDRRKEQASLFFVSLHIATWIMIKGTWKRQSHAL